MSKYLLTKRKKQIERSMVIQYLIDLDDLSRFNEIASKLAYTGKALFSFILPRQLWHKTSKIRIENGLLISGSSKKLIGIFEFVIDKMCFLTIMEPRGLRYSLTSVNFWQIGICCILGIALVSMTVW